MRNYSYLCTRFRLNGTMTERSFAPVAELVDAPDLGSGVSRRAGSSPELKFSCTFKNNCLILSPIYVNTYMREYKY